MKRSFLSLITFCTMIFLSACGAPASPAVPTSTATLTSTPDPCVPANLPAGVKSINDLMRQFDDYAALASNTPLSQLVQVIPPMQAIRRAAEDQIVPTCLGQLKKSQLQYMDTSIQTLLAFESKADPSILNAGISQARQYHGQYTLELARLLGITIVAPTSAPSTAQTPAAATTPAPVGFMIINPGPNPINLHVSPSLTSQIIATLGINANAIAIGKSITGEWILIQVPGQSTQTVWVYTTLVKFSSGDLNSLPVATLTP